jgi:cytidylate kinase
MIERMPSSLFDSFLSTPPILVVCAGVAYLKATAGSTTTKKKMAAVAAAAEAYSLWATLQKQDHSTSAAIISQLDGDADWKAFAAAQGDAIIARDNEDDEKLAAGIQIAVDAGVLPKQDVPPAYTKIDVLGKTPEDVCGVISSAVGEAAGSGCIVVLCGLSGTGKGTTVEHLIKKTLPNAVSWSNGNIFRSLTLLAVTWCEQQQSDGEGAAFDADAALTAENLETFMGMLSFGKFKGSYDIKIEGLGLDLLVGEVKNTVLKGKKVGSNIPTVAKVSQGHVVKFAAAALATMVSEGGHCVVLEGREATVNYVPTPYRFTLTMSDMTIIGKRRAAQVVAAAALEKLKDAAAPSDEAVAAAIEEALRECK